MHKYIFVDTNVFEQFQPIGDIDWLQIAACDTATLVVAPIVIFELNEHKDGATRSRLKKKSATVLSELRRMSGQTEPIRIRKNVDLEFRIKEPTIDFGSYQLSNSVSDDRLLAAAIEFALEKGLDRTSVLVATGDFGLELKARAQSLCGELRMPEANRLPLELDDDERELRELKRQLQEIQNASPDLRLEFCDASRMTEVRITAPQDRTSRTGELLAEERSKHPYLQRTTPAPPQGWSFSLESEKDISDYNGKLEKYFKDFEAWLRAAVEFERWHATSEKLEFQIVNSGGAPGHDIHIDIHFPDGFEVLRNEKVPKAPEKPKPPLTPAELFRNAITGRIRIPDFAGLAGFEPKVPIRANSWLSTVKKTNSYDVRYRVDELKHTLSEQLPTLYIHFPSYEEAAGFRLDYQIVAANYPKPFVGYMDVKVVRE
ncbi:MAG TPA: PIN domain-containing protein [Terriglobales bacterium]|nr:PIN domain-containing protein [Terriglobales bacterium]